MKEPKNLSLMCYNDSHQLEENGEKESFTFPQELEEGPFGVSQTKILA